MQPCDYLKSNEEVAEYLDRKGAVQLLTVLETDVPKSFSELKNEVNVVESTLSERLREGVELLLIKKETFSRDEEVHGNIDPYILERPGAILSQLLEVLEVDKQYRELMRLQREIEEKSNFAAKLVEEDVIFTGDTEPPLPDEHLHIKVNDKTPMSKLLLLEFEEQLKSIDEELVNDLEQSVSDNTDNED